MQLSQQQIHSVDSIMLKNNFSIFILGTTAVGKTKLSLDLCAYLNHNAQIISCDSKQLYKHANIMTAKSKKQELAAYKHHMVDCIELEEQTYNRNKYFLQIKGIANRLWKGKKTPVFIGGTNYYIEPVLFNVDGLGEISEINDKGDVNVQKRKSSINSDNEEYEQISEQRRVKLLQTFHSLTKQQKYFILRQYDPLMAQKLHKNDEVRITSFLLQYLKNPTVRPSQNYKPYSLELNNKNTVVFWIRNSNKDQHRMIVENRIRKMLDRDGIVEILAVFVYLDCVGIRQVKNNMIMMKGDDNSKEEEVKEKLRKRLTFLGIGQSIGYKEFFDFYYHFRQQLLAKDHNDLKQIAKLYKSQQSEVINYQFIHSTLMKNYVYLMQSDLLNELLLKNGTEQLIKDTFAYCKRQITWIRNRIFQGDQELVKRFYVLELGELNFDNDNKGGELQGQQKQGQKEKILKTPLLQRYEKNIKQRAFDILHCLNQHDFDQCYKQYQAHQNEFIQPKVCENPLLEWKKYQCKTCEMQLNGEREWEQHVRSKKHVKRLKYLQKKGEVDKWIQYRKEKQKDKINTEKQFIKKNQK